MSRYYSSILNVLSPSFANTYSLAFDGVDDYVECGTELGNSFGVTTNISISMWINPSVTSGNDLFFNIGSFSNSFGQIAFQLLSNKLYVKLNNGARNYNVAYTNTTDWQHLVFVYDGSNSANTKMYINNVEQSTTVAGVFPSSLDLSNLKTIIGGGYSVSYTYSGLQDEVGVPNDISSISGLTAWYRMGDNGSYKSPQWLIPENSNVANSRFSNYSFTFDGVDDYIDVGNDVSLNLTSEITCSAWVKFEGLNDSVNYGIISNFNPNSGRKFTFIYYPATSSGSRKLRVRINSSSNILSSYFDTVVDLSDDQWHHLAFTFDGTTNSNGLNVYVDGVNLNSFTVPNAGIYSSSGDTLIGSYLTSSWFMNGNIDEVAVFSSALSGTDITSIYNSGTPTTLPVTPIAHWKLGEEATFSTNWTVPDQVGSNNGTSANMTIEDRVGDAPNSNNNALSFNMTESDRETDTIAAY
jgi:hypothetical protein